MFLMQVVRTNSIPFAVRSADELSLPEKMQLVKEATDALKSGKGFRSAKDLHKSILRK